MCLLYRFIHNPKDFDFISSFLPGKVSQHHYSISQLDSVSTCMMNKSEVKSCNVSKFTNI